VDKTIIEPSMWSNQYHQHVSTRENGLSRQCLEYLGWRSSTMGTFSDL